MESALIVLLASVMRAVPIAPVTTALQLPPLTVTALALGAETELLSPLMAMVSRAPAVTSVLLPVTVSEVVSGMVTTELDPETVTSVHTPVSVTTSTRLVDGDRTAGAVDDDLGVGRRRRSAERGRR